MSSTDSDPEIISSFQEVSKTCVWCKEYTKLKHGKQYCTVCASKMYKECTRCHLPYPEAKYFLRDANRCNACQQKLEKERAKREKAKQALKTTANNVEGGKRKTCITDIDSPSKKFKLHLILEEC